jgi:hypothetical protein
MRSTGKAFARDTSLAAKSESAERERRLVAVPRELQEYFESEQELMECLLSLLEKLDFSESASSTSDIAETKKSSD